MTRLLARVRRAGRDGGNAMVIALLFLALFSVLIGVVLSFATTGLKTTGSARLEMAQTASSDGAVDGAIGYLQQPANLTAAGSVDSGATPLTAQTTQCFSMPAGQLDYASQIAVRCTPRTGSGTGSTGNLNTQPAQAVYAYSTTSGEGVVQPAAGTLRVQGDTVAAASVTNVTGATLAVTGAIKANGTCSGAGTITATSGTSCPASPAVAPGPPYLSGYDDPTAYPAYVTALPACAPVVKFSPGTYTDAAALSTLMNTTCAGDVFWFQPGVYYFAFTNTTGGHEWLINNANDDVVGGVASGWNTASATRPTVPYPTSASSAGVPDKSGCDAAQSGVEFVFGDDSRIRSAAGRVQLCSLIPGANSQHVAVYGPAQNVTVSGTAPNVAPSTSTGVTVSGGRQWTNAAAGAVVDGNSASVHIPNQGAVSALQISGFPAQTVPADATNISVTASVTEPSIGGTGRVCLIVGTTVATSNPCQVAGAYLLRECANNCTGPYVDSVALAESFTPAQVNGGLTLSYVASNYNNQPLDASVDGLTITVTYSAPLHATKACSTSPCPAYSPTNAATYALVTTGGTSSATNGFVVRGTIYAPLAALNLSTASVPYDVVDRGVIVDDLYAGMSNASTYTGPLISIPPIVQQPRDVVLEAYDASTNALLLRAEVKFTDSTGTTNGTVPKVLFWSHQ